MSGVNILIHRHIYSIELVPELYLVTLIYASCAIETGISSYFCFSFC